ncbi:TPA: hypothetical protein ACX6QA_003472 [Photobacterium damselae]
MKSHYKRIGDYVTQIKLKNTDGSISSLKGININKHFMPSVANVNGTDLSKYRVVKKNQFAFNPMHVGRDEVLPISMLEDDEPIIVSPAYVVFEVKDEKELLPAYLMMWCRRSEFDRNAWFMTDNSVRGGFSWVDFCDMKLPVPSITKQREIVREYKIMESRIALHEKNIVELDCLIETLYKRWFVDFDFPITQEYADITCKPELVGRPYKSSGGEMAFNENFNIDIPKLWESTTVKEFASKVVAGVIPKYIPESNDRVIGQRCVHSNIVDLQFSRPHLFKDDSKLLQFGDILVNSTGAGTLGRVGQIHFEPQRLSFDSNMTLVRAKKDEHIEFLGCFISSKQRHFVQICQGSTNQTRLYVSMIAPIEMLEPTQDVLMQFSQYVRSIRNYGECIRKEIALIKESMSLVLSKLSKY